MFANLNIERIFFETHFLCGYCRGFAWKSLSFQTCSVKYHSVSILLNYCSLCRFSFYNFKENILNEIKQSYIREKHVSYFVLSDLSYGFSCLLLMWIHARVKEQIKISIFKFSYQLDSFALNYLILWRLKKAIFKKVSIKQHKRHFPNYY